MDHHPLFFGLVLMIDTIYNFSIGQHSFKSTKLPFPNEDFIFTKSKEAILNKADTQKDWWKSPLSQLCQGRICFGISEKRKEIMESIGLIVPTEHSDADYKERKRKASLIKLNKSTNDFVKNSNPEYLKKKIENKSPAYRQYDKYFLKKCEMLSADARFKFVEFIADATIHQKEMIGIEYKKNNEDLKKTTDLAKQILINVS